MEVKELLQKIEYALNQASTGAQKQSAARLQSSFSRPTNEKKKLQQNAMEWSALVTALSAAQIQLVKVMLQEGMTLSGMETMLVNAESQKKESQSPGAESE